MDSKAYRTCAALLLALVFAATEGCTSRSITITTSPPGAEVSVNYRVIGVSPCRVGFTHYGCYRIEIRKDKYETLVREENIKPAAYGYEPITVITDNAIPARLNDDVYLHFKLTAAGDVSDRTALLERAAAAGRGIGTDKNGQSVQLAYERPQTVPGVSTKSPVTAESGTTQTVKVAPANPDDFKVKPLDVKEPEGPKIGKELGVKPTTPDKKPDPAKTTDAPKDPKKDPAAPRTPKSEELNFEKPDAPKPDAPKPDAPKK